MVGRGFEQLDLNVLHRSHCPNFIEYQEFHVYVECSLSQIYFWLQKNHSKLMRLK